MKEDMVVRTGSIWLRTWYSSEPFWKKYFSFGFPKSREIHEWMSDY
jgi:hypothetical protein